MALCKGSNIQVSNKCGKPNFVYWVYLVICNGNSDNSIELNKIWPHSAHCTVLCALLVPLKKS